MKACAIAYANIALAKYWGKQNIEQNAPAVPSLSVTLKPLRTDTEIEFSEHFGEHYLEINGNIAGEKESLRIVKLLNTLTNDPRIRSTLPRNLHARVRTTNSFPTASGLASSASGFAALVAAANEALGGLLAPHELSRFARRASASAARSIFGGFVYLPAGSEQDRDPAAEQIYKEDYWDLRVVIAVTQETSKDIGSTDAMIRTAQTSPYYENWVRSAVDDCNEVIAGLKARDIERLGAAMERSTMRMHASAMAADPAIIYFRPATLAALETVKRLRTQDRIQVWATMDAGPHVKAVCESREVTMVEQALARSAGVIRTIVAEPGPSVEGKKQ